LRWMAPEVVKGEAGCTTTCTDMFSFGRLSHFVVTGEHPFSGVHPQQLRMFAMEPASTLLWPPGMELTRVAQSFCDKCLSFDPMERSTAQEVHECFSRGIFLGSAGISEFQNVELPCICWHDGFQRLQDSLMREGTSLSFDVFDPKLLITQWSQSWVSVFGHSGCLFDVFRKSSIQKIALVVMLHISRQVSELDSESSGGPEANHAFEFRRVQASASNFRHSIIKTKPSWPAAECRNYQASHAHGLRQSTISSRSYGYDAAPREA
jgi:serine/threonine protein kinase